MRKLLTLAIPLLLGVGLLTAAIHSDPQNGEQSKRLQAGVAATRSLPAVIEEAAAPEAPAAPATTTTTAAPATTTTAAPTTTTSAAPATTTTTAKQRSTTPTTVRPRPTTTTSGPAQSQAAAPAPQPQVIDCGTGTASARANLIHPASSSYGLTATVVNESTKSIELDSLVVTADYGAAGKKQFTVQVAGRQIDARPGQAEVTFSIPESNSGTAPTNFVISDFKFHTAGLPECTSH
jgi:cytoskeletal protein RodZ